MVTIRFGQFTLATALALTLSGCVEGGKPQADGETEGDALNISSEGSASAATSSGGDVETPSVFELTDEGLWDGRPSLGGVWVAHASVKDPERVLIKNTKTGKSVIGALFRRESANPGPSLQLSSDAAGALEIIAGQPTEVSVVALRRAAVPETAEDRDAAGEVETAAESDTAAEEPVQPDAGAAPGIDPIAATAAAAIDAADGTAASVAESGADAVAGAADLAAPEPPKKCRWWNRKKCEAELAAAAAGGAATGTADPAAAADGAAIETATLDAPVAATVPATPVAGGKLSRPFVQIGIFSVEANAQRAADQMNASGLTAAVRRDQSQGKTFWRVVVGPAASSAERDGLVARIKEIGYPDAYPVGQ